ncbi:MAG: ferredoxin--NADP reductase [Cyclobacteriaceae bacterium]|nr:ferredoxin--NADP reductase [Cyclobacteriaceae bacterium]
MNDHYYNLQVKDIVQETADAITIVFHQPVPAMEYRSGQFLTLIADINGKEVRRSYSFCTAPGIDEDLAVTVKRVKDGLMSNFLPDHIKVNDQLRVMEPMGHFTTELNAENKRHVIMFAGGSGITPFMSHIKSLLIKEPQSIISLIYANRNIGSIIFKDELERIQTENQGRFHVIHILDEAPLNWQGPSGLLNPEMLKEILERIPDWGPENTRYLMCGPEGMMRNINTCLTDYGVSSGDIYKESFVAPTIDKEEAPVDDTIKALEVSVIYDGEEHSFTVEPGTTILETALDLDIDLPYSCQSGLCTACRGKLLSGQVKLDEEEGLSDSEREEGYILTCVGHPITDNVKIEIG